MACISLEWAIVLMCFAGAILLFREYQNMKAMKEVKEESDELRNAVYGLQREEKNFREKDFRKLLSDFNKIKDRADEHESENIRLKKKLGKQK